MKYPELAHACSRRGADMGRPSLIEEPDEPIKFRLYAMPMVDSDYDTGGAYWGCGSRKTGWMYHAYGNGPSHKNEMFMRAKDREDARKQVQEVFEKATFYR